jgi:hypothetical protein
MNNLRKMNAIILEAFFKKHRINWNTIDTTFESDDRYGRRLKFIIGSDSMSCSFGEDTIVLKYSEMMMVNHVLFSMYSRVKEDDSSICGYKIQEILSSEVSVRLSLCFRGDIIRVSRKILFGGAGCSFEILFFVVI